MANFGKLVLTTKGIAEQLRAQSGGTLTFSKIKMGSGSFTGDVSSLTDLVKVELSAGITRGVLSDDTYSVEAQFVNDGLTTGFYWREIGIYGVDASGVEYLYAYANSGTQADFIPAVTDSVYTKNVAVAIAVGSASSVTVNYVNGTYLDITAFNQYKTEIDNSIAEMKAQLETVVTTDELDAFKTELNSQLEEMAVSIDGLIASVNTINQKIGTGSISFGQGNLVDAVNILYQMLSETPAITSGTSEPSGGKDGDVYIKYE